MSVNTCRLCKRPYWRYTGNFWPAGYCSVPCWESRAKRLKLDAGPTASMALSEIRKHRRLEHGTVDLTEWYDCEMCEHLERRYAEAL